MIDNVAITCLLLAAKFSCESCDVVVNVDVARAMKVGATLADGKNKLGSMEVKMLTLLDKMFVSEKYFNMEQKKLNNEMKKVINDQNYIR